MVLYEGRKGGDTGTIMSNDLQAFLDGAFVDKKLIVVTNREPYTHKKTSSGIKVEQTAGGLSTALDDVLKAIGGTWVAWGSGSADREVVDEKNRIEVPVEDPSYILKRVWLSQSEVENYYHGYSNQVLWPLCHIALERVYLRNRFWRDYKKANKTFADAVLEEAGPETIIWVHDYHLCLLPKLLRDENPNLTIAHFWHIPWPDWSVFRICPQAKELIEGLLGNDLICFQIPLFVKNFMDCVKETLSAEVDYLHASITYNGHTTQLKAFPISIDFEKFNSLASKKETTRLIGRLKKKYGLENKYIGVGVDRLEYTKALLKRLQAINLFFERYKRLRKKFTFVQISAATRMKEPYLSYKRAVEKLINRINEQYGTDDWKPIVYIDEKLSFSDLVSFYRMADLAIISSIYDGMNLVAKEFVASQTDRKGVLILSELAGAADELNGAMLINPYDIENFSEAIYNALRLPDKEKRQRMEILREHVMENDIYRWISDILSDIMVIASIKSKKCVYLFDAFDCIKDSLSENSLFLFLDYDGTLTPIVSTPEKAVLSDKMRSIIERLKELFPIAIISGRSLHDLMERVGLTDILYAGNHGAEIWDGEREIISHEVETTRHILKEFLDHLHKSLDDIPGLFIEDKGATASIHFRKVRMRDLSRLFRIFKSVARQYEHAFRITTGKKVFEIRPMSAWHKGDAVQWLMERFGQESMPIYIGDDTTDEDAFMAVEGKGISIGVGLNCKADYYLKDTSEVEKFLKKLMRIKNG